MPRWIWMVCLFVALPAWPDEGVERLNAFYAQVHSLHAQFRQTVHDAEGERVQASRGEVFIRRPDRFRWDYREPYPQVVVGDGRRVWIYDSELEQVTVRPMAEALGSAPARVLSGTHPLEQDFEITGGMSSEGLEWVRLQPKSAEADFRRIRIGFGDTLMVMELIDNFDQTTRIELAGIERNPELDSQLFRFEVPEGVDVVGEEAF